MSLPQLWFWLIGVDIEPCKDTNEVMNMLRKGQVQGMEKENITGWRTLPHIGSNLAVLVVGPTNATEVYFSLSYPTELYRLNQSGTGWTSPTPQVLT